MGFIAAYAVLIAIASVIEVPISRGFASVQLNLLIRLGSLVVSLRSLGGLGVGAMVGAASISYFLRLRGLPVSVAAAASDAYIVITVLLSTLVLHQPLTKARGRAMGLTLGGVTLLALGVG